MEEEGIRYQIPGVWVDKNGWKDEKGSGVMMIWQIGHQDGGLRESERTMAEKEGRSLTKRGRGRRQLSKLEEEQGIDRCMYVCMHVCMAAEWKGKERMEEEWGRDGIVVIDVTANRCRLGTADMVSCG